MEFVKEKKIAITQAFSERKGEKSALKSTSDETVCLYTIFLLNNVLKVVQYDW